MYPQFYRRAVLLAALAGLLYLLLQVLDPLWTPLGWAALIAFLLHPLHERLTRRLRGRAGASAGVLTALTPFLLVGPLVIVAAVFAQQAAELVDYLRGEDLRAAPRLVTRLESFPVVQRALEWLHMEVSVSTRQVESWLANGATELLKSAAERSGTLALGLVGTVIGFFLMLFMLFFLLRDGRELVGHAARLVPIDASRRDELLRYLSEVTRAVVFGYVLTALIQGALVGIGLALSGVPAPLALAVFATLSALIPGLGTALVLVPALLYLATTGHWGAAAFLGAWSVGVGFADNFLRPWLTRAQADVSTLTVFIGVIGGISAFGFIGALFGPVLLALVIAIARFASEDRA